MQFFKKNFSYLGWLRWDGIKDENPIFRGALTENQYTGAGLPNNEELGQFALGGVAWQKIGR